jgi:UDP-glucose:(heptosyl)LPS alpha-1,3-glucosyltransferase
MSALTIAFVLFKYFPHGGLQRDFMRIARACAALGVRVQVHTLSWVGDCPDGFDVQVPDIRAFTNHRRYARFAAHLQAVFARNPVDLVVGFNRVPGLDVHFAADPCFAARAAARGALYRATPRCRHFLAFERAVFAPAAHTQVLVLTAAQQAEFMAMHGTLAERFTLLPPGIARDRMAGDDAPALRASLRAELGLDADERLLLLLGSGFRVKGLARALQAMAALPPAQRARTHLLAVGQDAAGPFVGMARRLGLGNQVRIQPGRDDVPRLLQGADLLIHPAHAETAGMVLLEAIVAGLPVLTTDTCGYAHHVRDADAGVVLPSPFAQPALDAALAAMLTGLQDPPTAARWRSNGIAYGRGHDLYGMPDTVARGLLERVQSARAGHVPAR